MKPYRILLLGTAILVVACGDARLRKLEVGISKDSAMHVMGPRPDRAEGYLVGGQMIEALFYGKAGADSGQTPEEQLVPVVVINGQVAGWGKEEWQKVAAEHKIQVKTDGR